MPEQINLTELCTRWDDSASIEQWVKVSLLELMTQKGKGPNGEDKFTEVWSHLLNRKEDEHTIIDVELKIAGVDVSFAYLIEMLAKNFDSAVKETATQYVKDGTDATLRKFEEQVFEMREQMRRLGNDVMHEIARTYNIKPPEDEYR